LNRETENNYLKVNEYIADEKVSDYHYNYNLNRVKKMHTDEVIGRLSNAMNELVEDNDMQRENMALKGKYFNDRQIINSRKDVNGLSKIEVYEK
jgi:hypothetical protein